MKKFLKIIAALVLAAVLVTGGYIAGQKVQMSSIVSAMPKLSLEKPNESAKPENSEMTQAPEQPAQNAEQDERMITKTESAVDSTWSVVQSTSNTTDNEVLTLYTSAQKDGDEFIWDDSQKWVVEISDGNGGYYTLYDQLVSNGNVYYDVVEKDNGDKIINVYTMAGSGTTIMRYTRTDNGFAEKMAYNSGAENKLFSTIPAYR